MQRLNLKCEKRKKRAGEGVLIDQFGISLGCEWHKIGVRYHSLVCGIHFTLHVPQIRVFDKIDYEPPLVCGMLSSNINNVIFNFMT